MYHFLGRNHPKAICSSLITKPKKVIKLSISVYTRLLYSRKQDSTDLYLAALILVSHHCHPPCMRDDRAGGEELWDTIFERITLEIHSEVRQPSVNHL